MSFLENFKLKENKLFESSLSSNNKSHKRYSSVKSENEISLKQNFYKTETKKYNEHLLVLNYLANCSKKRFSVKTALTDSENMDYDLSMINPLISPYIVHTPDNIITYIEVWTLSGELKGLIDMKKILILV